ncbi:kinase-like protein [Calocera viscosa TUFC12733]|uniref:Kinase-like protein n=1 Tax=Calocera viscosa (strain TUFC12733) TaxID=1330018 RepID=A0A167PQN8_CALVF|nr:kinase-like protein [Calocera viscosa TUFC12733]
MTAAAVLPSPRLEDGTEDYLQQVLSSIPNLTSSINDISRGRLASGIHGEIWQASYGGERVAIKTMRTASRSAATNSERNKRLANEMRTWTRLNHPSILACYGVCERGSYGFGLVSPWMEFQDVYHYLEACPEARRSPLVLDVTKALVYMHSLDPPLVHGNLILDNILVNSSGEACVAGFAVSGWLRDPNADLKDFDLYAGNPRWMAPEQISPDEYGTTQLKSFTPSSDIYSFGMVAYEFYSDRIPFYHITNRYLVTLSVIRGEHPSHPGQISTDRGLRGEMWDIVQDCWRSRPEERPSARELERKVAAAVESDP